MGFSDRVINMLLRGARGRGGAVDGEEERPERGVWCVLCLVRGAGVAGAQEVAG